MKWLAFLLTALLAACSSHAPVAPSGNTNGSRYAMTHDAAPVNPPDLSRLQPPVPKPLPLSSNNPASYTVLGKTYHLRDSRKGYDEVGMASWYGKKFQGYATSSGEPYDMYKFTAANKVLPLPCYAKVTNLANGKSVIVKINDRGPFHANRIIDLSWIAAKRLDILSHGTAKVRVQSIVPGEHPTTVVNQITSSVVQESHANGPSLAQRRYLQLGAFSQPSAATSALKTRVKRISKLPNVIGLHQDNLYKLWVGPFATDSARQQARNRLRQHAIKSFPVDGVP